jgi:two-component system chemotaxis sensor kinase CheA
VQRVLLLGLAREMLALPIARLERIVELPTRAIEYSGREAFVLIDDDPVPVFDLAARLSLGSVAERTVAILVITDVHGERVALHVDRVAGQQQIYVKPVPELLASVRALAGLTILGDGPRRSRCCCGASCARGRPGPPRPCTPVAWAGRRRGWCSRCRAA